MKDAAKVDRIECQLRFDKIEQFKKTLSMQKVFHAYKKDTKLVAEWNIEIFEVIAEKGNAYCDGEFIMNCLELFTRYVFPKKKYVVEQLSLSQFTVPR